MARRSNAAGQLQVHSFSAALISFSRCRYELKRELKQPRRNAKENVTLKKTSKYFKLVRDSFNSFNLSFRPTRQLQDVCLYSDTMAALKPYCFEPERAGYSQDNESGDD